MSENKIPRGRQYVFISTLWLAFLALSGVAFVFLACCIAAYFGMAQRVGPNQLDSWSKLGASLNPMANLLSFSALVISLVITVRNFTRQQDQNHRYYLEQQFENQLFQLIGNWRKAVGEVEAEHQKVKVLIASVNKPEPSRGSKALRLIRQNLEDKLRGTNGVSDEATDDELVRRREVIDSAFKEAVKQANADVGHCYRMLYHIVRMVDETDFLIEKEKRKLIGIVRSHLSETEFVLLFYNCLTEYGYDKMHPLVDEYDLLQNISADSILARGDWSLYPLTKDRWHQYIYTD